MVTLNFDATQIAPEERMEAIPAGWYNMRIVESEMKKTKAGDGQFLLLKCQVIDGEHANRVVFDRLNLSNPNPVAVEIAQRRLSAYCHATGVLHVQTSNQLHGIPFRARVTARADKTGDNDPQNEIRAIEPANQGAAHVTAPPQYAPPATQQAAPAQAQPWQNPTPQGPATQSPAQPWQQPPQQAAPWQNQGTSAQPVAAPPTATQPTQAQAPQTAQPGNVPPWAR